MEQRTELVRTAIFFIGTGSSFGRNSELQRNRARRNSSARTLKPVVQSEPSDALGHVVAVEDRRKHVRRITVWAGVGRVAEVDVEIFALDGPTRRHRPFDPAADRPAGDGAV